MEQRTNYDEYDAGPSIAAGMRIAARHDTQNSDHQNWTPINQGYENHSSFDAYQLSTNNNPWTPQADLVVSRSTEADSNPGFPATAWMDFTYESEVGGTVASHRKKGAGQLERLSQIRISDFNPT
jgi:hypothetical protein